MDLTDGLGVEPRAAVGKVIAGHARHGGVLQAHLTHRLGHATRLVEVERRRLARVDLAEVAAARALVAADEERRLAILPAFEDVGTAGLLAHGVQALGLHERLELVVLGAHRGLGADPLGLALDGGLRVAGLDAQHAAAFGCDGHTASLVRVAGEPGRRPAAGAVSARISDSADSRHETTVGTTSAMVTS